MSQRFPVLLHAHNAGDVDGSHLGRILPQTLYLIKFDRLDAADSTSFPKSLGYEACVEIQKSGKIDNQCVLPYLLILGREKCHIVHSDPGRFRGSQRGDAVAVADDRRRFSRLSDLSDRMKPYTAFGEKRGNRGDIFSDPRLPYL